MSDLFAWAKLVGTRQDGLALQTRRRTNIVNIVGLPDVVWGQRRWFADLAAKHGWSIRSAPNGIYNCAGLVWASRRTSIYDPKMYELILKEDDYRLVREDERPRVGDLIVYRQIEGGEILHVGMVSQVLPSVGDGWTARILSKLGPNTGEAFHEPQRVPYDEIGLPYRHEFYTDRPAPETRNAQ